MIENDLILFIYFSLRIMDIFGKNANKAILRADKLFNYFHPCLSYPISDIEIEVPRKL